MMELTKEEQIQAIYDLNVGYTLGHADIAMLKSMARQLLAGLEQEPVAYMYKDRLHTDARFSLHTRFGNWSQEDINEYEITEIPLYAAPQLPKPAVPTFDEWCAATDNKPLGWVKDTMREAYDGCRAAMLQGVENAETPTTLQTAPALDSSPKIAELPSGNSPVIPDGWVACSERMPMDGFDVLCTSEFDGPGDWRRKVGYWHRGKWVVYGASWTPTHWMPLPAAPQHK